MGTRSLVAVVIACALAGTGGIASADPKGDIQAKSKEAMENYDMMDYDAAKKLLDQAIAAANKAKLDKDPVVAKVYLRLGIAQFAAGDPAAAKAAFVSAVQIDSAIEIDAAYRSPVLTKLLDEAKAEAGGGMIDGDPVPDSVDCSSVKGLEHELIETAPGGADRPIEALVGGDLNPDRVAVMWRSEGETEFSEAKLGKQGDCRYTGQIPAPAMRGSLVHYYVAAYDANNKVIASRGSSGSPNIMELTAGGAIRGDDEDPINGNPGKATGGGAVSGGVIAGGKPPKIYIAVTGGTGFGYVAGKTEFDNMVETCCIGSSLVVITPELGYHVSPKLSIGLAARIGLPLGANIEGHSTMAPAGLLRLRFALSESGEGLRFMGQIGGGILRNTIKLNEATEGMDTDIVAQGPLLIGAGVGFTKKLSGNVAFIADLSALGALAVVKKIGTTPNLNNGVGADLSLGLSVGF